MKKLFYFLMIILAFWGSLTFSAWSIKPSVYSVMSYRGINLSGAEFNPQANGQPWIDGIPVLADADYFVLKGMNTIRLPIKWEYLQPSLNGPVNFDSAYGKAIDQFIQQATQDRHLWVIIDVHNYMRYQFAGNTYVIGEPNSPVTTEKFALLWGEIAKRYQNNPQVIFGVMNEPSNMNTQLALTNTNAAIAKIREQEGSIKHLILVQGNYWSGMHSWLTTDNATIFTPDNIKDPQNNYALDIHQYLDEDSSGSKPECVTDIVSHANMDAFLAWAKKNRVKVFVSEFGAPNTPTCAKSLTDFLNYLEAHTDVFVGWTAWSGGHAWNAAPGYLLGLSPDQSANPLIEKVYTRFLKQAW